jgi:hypothetical protein
MAVRLSGTSAFRACAHVRHEATKRLQVEHSENGSSKRAKDHWPNLQRVGT